MRFEDHFSRRADGYARFRPAYPDALFGYLAGLAPSRGCAWDCATGSGQAARGLAPHFHSVVGTDASRRQLAHVTPDATVRYVAATAERTPLRSGSVDLVTVAQALHWLDLPGFYAEARRALRPGGVVAAWCYSRSEIAPAVDQVVRRFTVETVGRYWPPGRRLVDQEYRTIRFPFAERAAPRFRMVHTWRLSDLAGYLGTWSATQRYRDELGRDPLATIADELQQAWGTDGARQVIWPLHLRVGVS